MFLPSAMIHFDSLQWWIPTWKKFQFLVNIYIHIIMVTTLSKYRLGLWKHLGSEDENGWEQTSKTFFNCYWCMYIHLHVTMYNRLQPFSCQLSLKQASFGIPSRHVGKCRKTVRLHSFKCWKELHIRRR